MNKDTQYVRIVTSCIIYMTYTDVSSIIAHNLIYDGLKIISK